MSSVSPAQVTDADLAKVTEVSRRRLAVNALSNYGGSAVIMLVGLFLQAFVIRSLGRDQYAIWPLANTCLAFANLLPGAIGSGGGRFMAHALGRRQPREVEQITTSLFAALSLVSVLYAVIMLGVSFFFERLFEIPETARGTGPWVVLLVGLAGAATIPFSVFRSGLVATQQYFLVNLLQSAVYVLRAAAIVLTFVLWSPSLVALAAVHLGAQVLGGTFDYALARRLVPWQRLRREAFSWPVLRSVASFSGLVVINQLAMLLYWQTDNIVINKLIDPVLLTGYSVVTAFCLQANSLVSRGVGVLIPAATVTHGTGDVPRMARMVFRTTRVITALGAPALVFLMIYGPQVMTVYIGPEYRNYGYLFLILCPGVLFNITQSAGGVIPQAFGRLKLVTLATLGTAVLNVLLSLAFVLWFHWGLAGVAAGTAIVTVFHKAVFWPWYVSRLLQVRWATYMIKTYLVPLGSCVPFAATVGLAKLLDLGSTLPQLACILAAGLLLHSATMVLWGLPPEERATVQGALSRLSRSRTALVPRS